MSATDVESSLLAAVERLTNLVAIGMTKGMQQREAIELLNHSSLSNNQIAAVLGTTPDSVRAERSKLNRAAKQPVRKTRGDVPVVE
jgi:hypothetical protein